MTRRARFGFALLTAGAVAGFATLGHWQLQRARDKDELVAAYQRALAAPSLQPFTAAAFAGEVPQWVGGPGRFHDTPVLLLDNQQRDGRVGVRELRLFRPDGAAKDVLVDMGWLPWRDRRELPASEAPPAHTDVRGLLVAPPGQGLRLGRNRWESGTSAAPAASRTRRFLLMYLDWDEIAARTGLELFPGLLRLDPQLSYGHSRDLQALPNTLSPERHRGYAATWFGLAALSAGLFLYLGFRDARRP